MPRHLSDEVMKELNFEELASEDDLRAISRLNHTAARLYSTADDGKSLEELTQEVVRIAFNDICKRETNPFRKRFSTR